ncbi:Conjugal transfer protein TraC (modular protein) [Agrobacterium tumefaciens str. B6]|uniref:Conjugal transfer protein TraC (Modular protein) n=3 Tax=Agrobacterium TaxID=357 RepID=A0A822V9S2_AGRTU|nr:Conjugal transfer protein TraC (modular protein) [Agrobacterium tumefaciens str. B6]
MDPLLRNGGIILQSVGLADVQICTFLRMCFWGNLAAEQSRQDFQGDATGMKKPSSKIREEIARLQDQLRQAETREAERIGRIALKAGLGEIEIEETELQAAFEEITGRFRGGKAASTGKRNAGDGRTAGETGTTIETGAAAGSGREA